MSTEHPAADALRWAGFGPDDQPRHDDGSPAPEDTIAKCKRILAAVDAYHDNPTQATRSDLRHVVYGELERAASGVAPSYEPSEAQITAALAAACLRDTRESRKDMRKALTAAARL